MENSRIYFFSTCTYFEPQGWVKGKENYEEREMSWQSSISS